MTTDSMYLIDQYVTTRAGEPYRLFPFGVVVKGGKRREITPEFARTVRLPHFKPPIKRGSHEDTTPAGGHIVALEVRADGLYAVPEYTERGLQDLADGAYRYHSPEMIWDGGLEDPVTGELIPGPLIVGDALLHTPHLGEAAALYSVEPKELVTMTIENVTVPAKLWDRFVAWFDKRADEPEPQPEPPVAQPLPEEYSVKLAELEQYKAEVEQMKAQAAHAARVEQFDAEVATTKANREGLAELLAGMSDETAGRILQELKALSAQVNESALTGETGSDQPGAADPVAAFEAAVRARMDEKKIGYIEAFEAVRRESPDLLKGIK